MAGSTRATQRATSTTAARPRTRNRPAAPESAAASTTERRPAASATAAVPADLRHRWIAEAAYYRAQQRGFRNGSPEQDWAAAEADIDRMLAEGGSQRSAAR